MNLMEHPDMFDAIDARGRLAGLDLGTKTIGVAICDAGWQIATPVETIQRVKFTTDATLLMALLARREVAGIVIGLPLNMDGSEGPRCQATRAFVRNLQAKFAPPPIAYWDERLSTAAVTRTLIAADASRQRRSEVVDRMAAAYILQGALDFLARRP